jgi:NAD(P)-dependent dehydrogenase (short-subunit alcohol dehydrogenase family)
MAGKLDNKVAIITGASSGIGEATAIALAAEGAKVVIAARRGDRLEALAKRIESSGGKALPIVTDITDETQANNLIHKANAELGRVDILVNNAGVALTGNIDAGNTSDWRRMFDVNVFGLLYATHAVLPILKAQGVGHIGPHPKSMYQVAFAPNQFTQVLPWLMLNREGLDILLHPETGDDVTDHTAHALWLGNKLDLNIGFLQRIRPNAS